MGHNITELKKKAIFLRIFFFFSKPYIKEKVTNQVYNWMNFLKLNKTHLCK